MLGLELTEEDMDLPLQVEVVGELTAEDLSMLGTGQVVGSTPIKKLRARHQALAKALAQGMRPSIAAATYGYTAATVSTLQADPTFKELVSHYQQEDSHDYAQIKERLIGLSVEAMDELDKRLETEPESLTPAQLMRLIEITTDRTGHGAKQTQDVNVNFKLGERLRAAQEQVKAAKQKTIELEKEEYSCDQD